MTKAWKMVIFWCSLIFLVGCATRVIDFTVISSKNVQVPSKGRGQRVEGSDCTFLVPPNMKEALDRAIESSGGNYDALVDGVVYFNSFWLYSCYKVEGTPINTRDKSSMKDFEGKDVMYHSKRSNLTSRN